jgi:CubicO group peptidase (beta-lactamase class C family)
LENRESEAKTSSRSLHNRSGAIVGMNLQNMRLEDCFAELFKQNLSARLIKLAVIAIFINVPLSSLSQSRSDAGPLAGPLKPYIEDHDLAGAVVLVANRNRVIDREALGYADIASHRALKPTDIFWIASMSKPITAAAVMMLVDEGKVDLDDPVEKYLPEFTGQKVYSAPRATSELSGSSVDRNAQGKVEPANHPITVREILSHTSGLPFSSKLELGALDLLPLSSSVKSYAAEPLAFQPGERYSYSNEGFNTAGRIVEVVSGTPIEEFLERRLFQPLGMRDTTFWPSSSQLQRLAKSYARKTAGGDLLEVPISQLTYPLDDRKHRHPFPAGGLFSTADDMTRFCQMMLNQGVYKGKRYLSQASTTLITTKETGSAVTKEYGFGWNVGDGYYEHSGAYKTDMKVDQKRHLIIILLVQRADEWPLEDRERLMTSIEQAGISCQPVAYTTQ